MTELLTGAVEVRVDVTQSPVAIRRDGAWHDVREIALTWRVETDWWRVPVTSADDLGGVRRDYVRCLLADGECIDVCRDINSGDWFWVRRYD